MFWKSKIVSQMIQNLDDDEYLSQKLFQGGQRRDVAILTEKGLRRLLTRSRSPHVKGLAVELGYSEMIFPVTEQSHLETIIRSISGIINYKTQYYVSGYRVDLYLPEINMVIECDEHDHIDRDSEYEREREQKIMQTLGCEFYRFNPYEPGFNIGDVINLILRLVCFQIKNQKAGSEEDTGNIRQPAYKTETLRRMAEDDNALELMFRKRKQGLMEIGFDKSVATRKAIGSILRDTGIDLTARWDFQNEELRGVRDSDAPEKSTPSEPDELHTDRLGKIPAVTDDVPKNYRGWNLNKRGKNKKGETLFNLVRKVGGKKKLLPGYFH